MHIKLNQSVSIVYHILFWFHTRLHPQCKVTLNCTYKNKGIGDECDFFCRIKCDTMVIFSLAERLNVMPYP